MNILVAIYISGSVSHFGSLLSVQESKEIIEKFIADREVSREGPANQNDVVRHMNSVHVPEHLKKSRKTTIRLINELVPDRIKIQKHVRPGQSDRLLISKQSQFNKINEELTVEEREIEKIVISKKLPKEYPAENIILRNIINALFEAEKLPQQDSQIIWARIKKLLLALAAKRVDAITGSKYYQAKKIKSVTGRDKQK